MKPVPNGYLTLEKRVRKPFRITPAELAAGAVDWWDRLADRVLGGGSDALAWRLLGIVVWLLSIVWAYNVGLRAG